MVYELRDKWKTKVDIEMNTIPDNGHQLWELVLWTVDNYPLFQKQGSIDNNGFHSIGQNKI